MTLRANASRLTLAASIAASAWAAVAVWSPAGRAQGPEKREDKAATPEKLPKCVHVRGEARFSGFGYDHLVEVQNSCDKQANCRVATDVNPQAQSLQLNAGEKQSVVTFRGSPASAFRPDVSCKLAS